MYNLGYLRDALNANLYRLGINLVHWLMMNEFEQWPGSYCDTRQGCCFPIHGAPGAFFGIHGLWPNYNDGSYPESCGGEPFNPNTVCNRLIIINNTPSNLLVPPILELGQKFWME